MYDILFPGIFNTWLRDPHVNVRYPGVKRVLFNKNITKIEFSDGTWTLVRLSENDTPNRETAVLYALVKRIYGTLDYKTYEVKEGAVGNKIRKLVESAVDQDKITAEKAAKAKVKKFRKDCMTKVEVKKPCSCVKNQCLCSSGYKRPDKPFSEFTTAEKRAYWRAQKRGLLRK